MGYSARGNGSRVRPLLALRRRRGGLDAWADCFTDDVVYVEHVLGTMHGREAVRAWIKPIMAQFGEIYSAYVWHMTDPETGRICVYIQNRRDHPSGQGTIDFPGITILHYAGTAASTARRISGRSRRRSRRRKPTRPACKEHDPEHAKKMTRRDWGNGPAWTKGGRSFAERPPRPLGNVACRRIAAARAHRWRRGPARRSRSRHAVAIPTRISHVRAGATGAGTNAGATDRQLVEPTGRRIRVQAGGRPRVLSEIVQNVHEGVSNFVWRPKQPGVVSVPRTRPLRPSVRLIAFANAALEDERRVGASTSRLHVVALHAELQDAKTRAVTRLPMPRGRS
jgi:hypothetical protein